MWGERIAALRVRLGWSQAELARRLHISPSAVGMYEQGRREPSLEVMVSLSQVFGVSLDFLLTGKSICHRDIQAQTAISGSEDPKISALRGFSHFSKDELLVLLAASVFGSEYD